MRSAERWRPECFSGVLLPWCVVCLCRFTETGLLLQYYKQAWLPTVAATFVPADVHRVAATFVPAGVHRVTVGGCRQHWQDSPESTKALYRSALKTWLEYCDLLRRINPAATNAPWPDTKVRFYIHLLPRACPCPAPVHS